jgi:hypothetical protein
VVRPEYKYRYIINYFSSVEERQFWVNYAKERDIPLNKLMLQALALLKNRESEALKPTISTKEIIAIKEENRLLQKDLKQKTELLNRYEAELYKIRHAGFSEVQPSGQGSRQYDMALIALLKRSKSLDGPAILSSLGIDPSDVEAHRLVWNQLESLQGYGLVEETKLGWRWIK